MEFKPFKRKPETVMAMYFEKAGTFDIGSAVVEMEADTYLVRGPDSYETRDGKLFRAAWEEDSSSSKELCQNCGGDPETVEIAAGHAEGCSSAQPFG